MNTATKTIASVATAAVVATGTYLGVDYATNGELSNYVGEVVEYNTSSSPAEGVDDVTAVTVEVPVVAIPTVTIPKVGIPTVDTPLVNSVVSISEAKLKDLGIDLSTLNSVGSRTITIPSTDGVKVTKVTVSNNVVMIPSADGASIRVATVSGNVVIIPSATAETVKSVKINGVEAIVIPEATYAKVDSVSVGTGSVVVNKVDIPEVEDYTARIPLIIEFQKQCSTIFKDARNIRYDKTFTFDNPVTKKWMQIYKMQLPDMHYVPMPTGIRMIAEVKVPKDAQQYKTLEKNLEYYKKLGYTHVLVSFDGSESEFDYEGIITYVKSFDFKVFTTYGGDESLHISVFIDPTHLSNLLKVAARNSDGFLLGWRRTSLHLFLQDDEYVKWVSNTLRSANPNLVIVGESYLGNSAVSDQENKWKVVYNAPKNVSAILIAGIGMNGINIPGALNNLFKEVKTYPRLGLVTGDSTYYATRNFNGRSFEENVQIKIQLEQKFLRAGCVGTITLHGDGSGTNDKHFSSDNLCYESQRIVK